MSLKDVVKAIIDIIEEFMWKVLGNGYKPHSR
jgi:hypothetical protein